MTRNAGHGLIQLIYTLWMPASGADNNGQVDSGALDGLIFRVTLDKTGLPVVFDTMHPSGREHHFIPTANAQPRSQDLSDAINLPVAPDGYRVRIRLTKASNKQANKLASIDYVVQSRGNEQFALVPEHALRSLPLNGDLTVRRSLYGPDGLIAGTASSARYTLWPSGIDSIGAVRQWGHHATSLTDRRHFDDANLIEQRYKLR